MTVSHIITILSACDFIDDLKIIEENFEYVMNIQA